MKILNLDNPVLCRAFRAHGCDVFSIGHSPLCDQRITRPVSAMEIYRQMAAQARTPDLAFYCDSGNLPYFTDVEKLPCPVFFYSIDTYCNHWHFLFGQAFDLVFTAQKGHAPIMAGGGAKTLWLPLFARAGVDVDKGLRRYIPVAFVGTLKPKNIPDREPFLRAFAKAHPIFIASGEYVDIFNRAAIVLNNTAASEVNFRCFEAMACGAALLMEESPHGLGDIFTEEHILPCYKRLDAQSAAGIAYKALEHPERLARLAARGRDLVMAGHLDAHRAAAVISEARLALGAAAQRRRLDNQDAAAAHLRAAYGAIYADLNDPRMARHRKYFLKLSEK